MGLTPRVSIGMPVYNGERFIREALDSILAQTFTDFELIISDNGSTDGTEQICREYAARDPRIHYYRNEQNRGAAWNHNRLVELARAEYFKWQCHDDLCEPTFLDRCVPVLDRDPSVVLCYPRFIRIDEQGKRRGVKSSIVRGEAEPHERYRSLICRRDSCEEIYGVQRAAVMRRTQLIANYSNSDDSYLAELILHGKFCEVPEPLFLYRLHPSQSTKTHPNSLERMAWFDSAAAGRITVPFWHVFTAYFRIVARSPQPWWQRMRCYGHTLAWFWTFRWWFLDDLSSAWSYFFQLRLVPFFKRHLPWTQSLWRALKRAMAVVPRRAPVPARKRARRREGSWELEPPK